MLINSQDELLQLGVKENGEPLQVFVVDDSVAMVKIISRILTDFGLQVVGTAPDGQEAIHILSTFQSHIDLICLDITMPHMDGLTALPEIRKLRPDSKILMVSAMGDKHRVLQAMQHGANYFVVKPFNKPDFYGVLKMLFNK
jgi:two-component system chemotaxis response regulator CheY